MLKSCNLQNVDDVWKSLGDKAIEEVKELWELRGEMLAKFERKEKVKAVKEKNLAKEETGGVDGTGSQEAKGSSAVKRPREVRKGRNPRERI